MNNGASPPVKPSAPATSAAPKATAPATPAPRTVSRQPQPVARPTAPGQKPDATAARRSTGPSSGPARFDLSRIKVGAASQEALVKETGGTIERIGRHSTRNAFMLNVDGQRFVYVRLQGLGEGRNKAYSLGALRKTLDPAGAHAGYDLDHIASTAIEGRRMGNRYALLGLVRADVNQSHGRTSEKGPAPVREFQKAATRTAASPQSDHVSPWTREMMMKASDRLSDGRGHALLRDSSNVHDPARVRQTLLQDDAMQARLADLAHVGRDFDTRVAARRARMSAKRGTEVGQQREVRAAAPVAAKPARSVAAQPTLPRRTQGEKTHRLR